MKNGRQAVLDFNAHFEGSSAMDSIADHAENTLEPRVYQGERGRYSFETHISIHRNAHNNIQLMTGTDMSGRDKVQKLLNLITALNVQL